MSSCSGAEVILYIGRTPTTLDLERETSLFPGLFYFAPLRYGREGVARLARYNEILSEFKRYEATIAGITIDYAWCHVAFAKNRNLRFPLLADFHSVTLRRFVVDGEGGARMSDALHRPTLTVPISERDRSAR